MTALGGLETIVGGLLVFFVPGYFTTRALFPEWRLRGPTAPRRLVETLTLSFVLSVTWTVLVGYLLLTTAPGGFQAYWTDPVLEGVLAGVSVVALGAGVVRGAYGRTMVPSARAEPDPAGSGAWELSRELDRLEREERRLRRALRSSVGSDKERDLQDRLATVESQTEELRRRREAEYAE
jgi:Protein of unknown function (DUF1616)